MDLLLRIRERFRTAAWALVVYCGAMTVYVYAFEHREDADYARQTGADEILVLLSVALLHVALGAVVGRWPVALAPALAVVIAVPAGDYPGGWPDIPVAATIATQMLLFGVPLVAIGVVLRRMMIHRGRARLTPRAR